ncbi:MAG: hypothetical protein WA964_02605 [Ilumatobacter sp.]|uniref:hypothetical protein n=1 Tax=Ilumatobacter sp. TaxID=1967498 RepID=UPI003C724926
MAAATALVVAGVFALLWLGARSSESDTASERDAAIAERDAATQTYIDANAQLQTAQDELADAREALDDESGTVGEPGGATAAELQQLEDRTEELSAEVERLEDENEVLATDLAAAATPAVTTADEPDAATTTTTTATAEPADAAPATTAAATVSFEDVGDQISGLFRPSVLGTLQKRCLGEFVVEALGEERVLAAIASESPVDDEEFVDVVSAAAEFCLIDQSAIFG